MTARPSHSRAPQSESQAHRLFGRVGVLRLLRVRFTRAEIAYFVKDITQRRWMPVHLPKPVAKGLAGIVNNFGEPFMSPDEIELMDSNVVVDPEVNTPPALPAT
jgi:hypothetical protein